MASAAAFRVDGETLRALRRGRELPLPGIVGRRYHASLRRAVQEAHSGQREVPPAMQSSTAVVFRALVMLACLVAIPLAAVVGKSLPDMARGLLQGRWPARSTPTSGPLSEAPRFVPTLSAGNRPSVSAQQPNSEYARGPLQDAPAWPGGALDPGGSSVVPAGYEAPADRAPESAASARRAGAVSLAGQGVSRPPAPALLAAPGTTSPIPPGQRRILAPEAGRAPTMGAGPSGQAPQTPSTVDQFTYIQDRLRQLGATYHLLESWGSREQLYRFYCKVAVGGNPNYTHYFEATDSDPLRAMTRVLGQVEAWRAGRQ